MEQYAEKLPMGVQALLKRWPDYRIDVYPTHRSYPAMPEERAKGTLRNASNPECKTEGDGVGLRGCWFGTPFPVPKTGYEGSRSILRNRAVSARFAWRANRMSAAA
jgi:hypothetical protein